MYSRGRILLQLSPLTTGKVKGEIWLVSDVLLPSFHLTWLPSSWQCFKAACVLSGSFSLAPEALLSMLSAQDGDNDSDIMLYLVVPDFNVGLLEGV